MAKTFHLPLDGLASCTVEVVRLARQILFILLPVFMGLLWLKGLLVLAHLVTAASWWGLGLRLAGQARLAATLEPPLAQVMAQEIDRIVGLMRLFIVLTWLFGLGALFAGGGFLAYGPAYHTALLAVTILVFSQYALLGPAARGLLAHAGDAQAALPHAKRMAMGTGIGHLLWLVTLVLMVLYRFGVGG